jgi:hypothetical protein
MGRTNYSYSSLLSAVIKTLYYRYASYEQNKSTLSDRVTEDAQNSTRRDYSLYPFLQEEYNVDAPQLETLDFIPPLITLIGQNPQILERYTNYTDPGATTEYGSTIISTDYSQLDPTTQGEYEVTYTASDGVNTTTGTRVVRVVDTVPPEASLIGDNPYILERYLDYVDPGLNLDQGSFIANIDTSQLNNTVPGDYTITYTVSDGTNEITLTRDITVVDTVSPVITLIGNDPYLHEMYTQYEDPGVALDRGSVLTSTDTSQLDINTAGSYTITYTATDGINTRTATRTVTVADTTSPVITLNGANPYYVARYTQYNDPDATVDEGSTLISTDTSQVDTFNPGSYNVVYTANDGFFTSTAIRTVIVKNPPILTLSGPPQYYVQLGSTYTDPGVTSDLGESVTIDTSGLDMNTRGTYIVSYIATDVTGVSTTGTRTVIVDAPIITLTDSNPYYVQIGSSYIDPGATSDNGEAVTVDTGNLDMNTRGSYTITYSATDNRGFIGTTTRTVIVDAPVITLIGSETYYVGVGTVYIDPGAISDGGENVTIDTSALDINTIGTYTITYTATDSRGFIGTTTRSIVVDINIITLVGENPYYVQLGSTFTEPGATTENGEVITVNSNYVDTTIRGFYSVIYSATSSNGVPSFVTRIVIVDAPVISLVGSNPLYVARGTTYTDPGATSDGGETVTIDSSGVNMNLEDQYTVTYTAVDSRGFTETITRTVIVDDPVFLTLKGDNPYLIGKGTNYIEYGATSDNLEQVVIDTSTLDINTNGTYTVTYTATRENGIVGTATRTVIVDSPVITLTGDNPYYVGKGTVYTDPGATSDGGEVITVDTSNIVMNTKGNYTVTYSATDSNGFLGTTTRTVVVDAPVITLGGTNPQYVLTGGTYSEYGATSDGGETVTINSSSIDVNTQASYNVSYTATDSNGFVETVTREVVVKNAPVITLFGNNPHYVGRTLPDDGTYSYYDNLIFDPYIDPGFISDGGEVVTYNPSSVDMNTNGTYTLTYNASNVVTGFSSSTTRSVIVEDAPIIQVYSPQTPIYREIGDSSDPGAFSLTGETVTSDFSQVDYNTRGVYTVYYSASNSNGTIGRAFRTVYVREPGQLDPTITLTGDNPYYVQRGSTYTDPGATADILEAVSLDTSNLNMNTNGTYTVTYTTADFNGLSSTTTRTVIVDAPIITLEPEDIISISRGTTYSDPGATSDGGETLTTDLGGLNINANGVYTITYSATNEMGFVGTATRTVKVGGPLITLQGPNPYYVGQGSLYYDPGATSSGGEFVKINTSGISLGSQGTFIVTYTATDSNTLSNTMSRVVVYDSRPSITLKGLNPYYVQKDSTFADPGSVSSSGDTITIDSSNVDMNTRGTYYVTHSFTDSLNRFCTMTRTVVVDSPIVTLVGDNPQYVVTNTSYVESGVISDGDDTIAIDSSSVDTTTNGSYTVTYTVTDRDGFVSTVSRNVIVTTPSVITLVGDNPYIVELNSEYVDPGATSSGGETVTVDTSNLNMSRHLSQYVTYSATNSDGYVTTLQRTVDVRSSESKISLSGSNPYYVLRGTTYIDPGATHDDGYTITTDTSQLDMATNGTYTVTYTYLTDVVTRTVIVDSASLTLLGDNPYYVKHYYTYVDPGVTSDNGETVLIDTQYLDVNIQGDYVVYYSVRRGDGYLLTTTTRTVIVTEPPVITLLGADPLYLYRGLTFPDPGATSSSGGIVTYDTSRLNEDVIGTYRVYYYSSYNGVVGSTYRNVIVINTPTILLRGPDPLYMSLESSYEEYGFETTIPGTVTIDTSELDVNTRGTYTVKYSLGDIQVGRTVIVEGPIITLYGENPIKLILNEVFDDPGATADGGERVSSILTNLDTSVSGVQEVSYIANNSRGNSGIERRTVIVTDTAVEEITSGAAGGNVTRHIAPGLNGQISGDGNTILTSTFLYGPNFIYYITYDYSNNTLNEVSNVIDLNQGYTGNNPPFFSVQSAINYDGTRIAIANMVKGAIEIYNWDSVNSSWSLDDTITTYPQSAVNNIFQRRFFALGGGMDFSTDGNTLIFSACGLYNPFQVYVYHRVNGSWVQKGSTLESNYSCEVHGVCSVFFGKCLSVGISGDGNTIILGRYSDMSPTTRVSSGYARTGSAIVYDWNSTTSDWVQRGSWLLPGDRGKDTTFGYSVCITTDGNRIAVGSSNFAPEFVAYYTFADAAKFVIVYDWDSNLNDWVQVGSSLTEVGATRMKMSGNGDRIIISNPIYNDFSTYAAGRVLVYQYKNGDWVKITAPITGDQPGEYLGYDVGISKDGTLITARGRDTLKVYSAPTFNYETDAVLLGDNPYYVEQGTTYTDPGVTITSGETVSIQVGDLNMNVAGTYDVHTLVLNQSGTVIRENVRTVIVEDGPVITLTGDNPYVVGNGTTYIDPGVTADGGETVTIDTSALDMNTNGIYTITYTATNAKGYVRTNTRTVSVESPIITLQGYNPYYTEINKTYIDPGVHCEFGEDVTIDTSNLDITTTGTYTVNYSATDDYGFVGTNSRTVIVDNPPVITVSGDNPYYGEVGSIYTDPGASSDGGESVFVNASNVNSAIAGTYTIYYRSVNSNGFIGRASREVFFGAPVITLVGNNPYYVQRGSTYSDPGATSDGGETVTVDTSNLVMGTVGTYIIYYSSTATNGVTRVTPRTVIVDERVITLNGNNPQYVDLDSAYTELGATVDNGDAVTINSSTVDTNTFGSYTVTYSVVDFRGITGTATRNVIVDSPILTLSGNNPYYLGNGYTYVDPGVTSDGGETVTIDSSQLDVNTNGSYTVYYSVTDANGLSETASRTVIVETAPTFTLSGDNPYILLRTNTYTDPGAIADGGETVTIDTSELDVNTLGTYTITYTATNANGTIGLTTRSVIITDLIISLSGLNPYNVDQGTTYTDPGASTTSGQTVTVDTSALDMTTIGAYTVNYTASDSAGNTTTTSRTVVVQSPVPVITLIGDNPYIVEKGSTYTDPGATANGGETVTINTSALDMTTLGTYTINYSATGTNGKTGTATRTVIVQDTTPPVLTVSGNNPYYVEVGTTYTDPGATADGGETVTVDTGGLDTTTIGTYTITYSATDSSDNTGTATRTVIVQDTIPPVITLIGSNPYYVPVGGTYTDPGATADGGETVTVDMSGMTSSIVTNGGSWTATYTATDSSGNIGTASRTVYHAIREPTSGFKQPDSENNYTQATGECAYKNTNNILRWNNLTVYSAPSFDLPITRNGWTYEKESAPFSALPVYIACPPYQSNPTNRGAWIYRIYRWKY